MIDRAAQTADKAQARWKKLAQERASMEAASILDASEMRARKTWEAKRIQAMALAKAKALADNAQKKAEEERTRTFVEVEETSSMSSEVAMAQLELYQQS